MPTVLIVDDSIATRTLSSYMLTSLGITPLFAEDGQQALDICAQKMPDAILLDWNMPVMDGPEFQERLKTLDESKRTKVIFCTSKDEFDSIAKVMSAGADGFIIKPFNLQTLTYNLKITGVLKDTN